MANKKNETALAVADTFTLADRYEGLDPDIMAEIEDELGDLDPESGISCRKVKIPSGGGIAFEIQGDDDGDEDVQKQIDAVVIFTHRANGYWPKPYGSGDDTNEPPACSSMDGKTAVWAETGEVRSCENCPFNEYGSGVDQTGQASRGKACKNMRRIYFMMSEDPNLYLLTVPPTSVRDVNKQLTKILAGGTPYVGMILRFTLEKAANSNGVAYSKVIIKKVGALPPAVTAQATALRRQIKDQYKSVALTLDDYAPGPAQGQQAMNGAVDVPPMSDEEWQSLTGEAPAGGTPDFQDAPAGGGDADLPFA